MAINRYRNYEFTRRQIARHVCLDCKRNVIELGDYCVIDSKIWKDKLGLNWSDNLCIACVETRLGRKLTPLEVGWGIAPGVEGYEKSNLLLARAMPDRFDENGPLKKAKDKKAARKPTRAKS
jgi:hypothetical protein